MSEQEQIAHFDKELGRLVDRFAVEYEMTYAAVVGCLFMKAHVLCDQAKRMAEDDAEDGS